MRSFSKFKAFCKYTKCYSTMVSYKDKLKMKSWAIHGYGDALQLTETRIPLIRNPDDVLIKVNAASLNPIDIAMTGGYGSSLIGILRQTSDAAVFPLTMGRDFSGTIIDCGPDIKNRRNKIGQKVWGVVPVHLQGSHAEMLVVPNSVVHKQPSKLNDVEATSMMYAGVTAWSALWLFGGLNFFPIRDKRVLVLGASGGVGCMATQILKAAGAAVIATCSEEAVPLVESFGIDGIIDYKSSNYNSSVLENGPYEIIFDCAGQGPQYPTQNNWKFKTYLTLTTPLLKNSDQYGVIGGLAKSSAEFVMNNVNVLSKGSTIRWAFFTPSSDAIAHIGRLVEMNKILPVIDEVFHFDDVPEAYEKVSAGHLRGKVVISMDSENK